MPSPSKEQQHKFWEWCKSGDEYVETYGHNLPYWEYDGIRTRFQPELDLNNLFKYAVPRLAHLNLIYHPPYITKWLAEVWGKDIYKHFSAHNDDPALALFWAIWEVINEGETVDGR